MLHVLIGENTARDTWEEFVRSGRAISWIVPKAAEPGDEALFVFNRDKFIGAGVIASEPEPDAFQGKPAFRADVRDLKQFKRPLDVDEVAAKIPEWKWPDSYTKGRTTPDDAIARKLSRIVAEHVARVSLVSSRAEGGKRGKGREPKKQKESADPKDVKLSGSQLDAVIREQTSGARLGAEGRKYLRTHVVTERKAANRKYLLELRAQQGPLACEACGIDLASCYGPEHREVLELHHRIPLSRGVQRPKGTEAFALLCPTCHRVVHFRREEPMDVEVLRERLRGTR
jgi:hypothetical protein